MQTGHSMYGSSACGATCIEVCARGLLASGLLLQLGRPCIERFCAHVNPPECLVNLRQLSSPSELNSISIKRAMMLLLVTFSLLCFCVTLASLLASPSHLLNSI